jgi:ATP-dependent protease ClpP protease subunit
MTWTLATDKTKKADDKKDSSSNFESEGNTLYFYSGVDDDSIFSLNKELEKKDQQLQVLGIENNIDPPPIRLKIHSYGGSVFSAFAAINYIKNTKCNVHTYVDGAAASAGTLMSVVGTKRYISENAYMLIHQLSSVSWGNYEQLKDDMINNKALMKRIRDIYEQYTKIPKTKLKDVLKRDLWWDAKTCLEYGLVDDII